MQKQKWRSASSTKNNQYTLVTGANGFIGSALCQKLLSDGRLVKGTVRSQKGLLNLPDKVVPVETGAIDGDTPWGVFLEDVEVVIHLAGVTHKTSKRAKADLSEYQQVHVIATEHLARCCAQAGVRRFIFLSSIGVNGEFTDKKPFTENDAPNPVSVYAASKWEAEKILNRIAEETGMEIVILRPPLVYGPRAPRNFARLLRLIKTGLSMPFGAINNSRSYVYLHNLVDATLACIDHPSAIGQTFLINDGQNVSTPDLIKMIALAMGRRPNLFSLHPAVLKTLCKIAGMGEEMEKLAGSLCVDSSKIRKLLGWKPPFTLEEGIKETIKHYYSS